MLRELLSAFNTPAAVGKGIVGVPSHDHYITKRLARYYKEKGNYTEALKYFTALVPGGSGCGTCNAEMRYERDLGIGECLIRLGREDEALEKHLMPYLTPAGVWASPDVARLVVSVHEKRGDLASFVFLCSETSGFLLGDLAGFVFLGSEASSFLFGFFCGKDSDACGFDGGEVFRECLAELA